MNLLRFKTDRRALAVLSFANDDALDLLGRDQRRTVVLRSVSQTIVTAIVSKRFTVLQNRKNIPP